MYTIRILNNISPIGLQHLEPEHYKTTEDAQADAILLRSASLHDMSVAKQLKAIARAGAGVNNIPVDKMTNLGIPVFNTPGANANAVKELVLASLLIACRNLFHGWNATRKLQNEDIKQVESIKKQFAGQELMGKTLGIIGLGAIGGKVANAAVNLGMEVIAYDPHLTIQNAWQLSPMVTQAKDMASVLAPADFITIHVPYLDTTHHLINADVLALLKPQATLLNFSRGGIVDDQAVVASLEKNHLKAYLTDFPSEVLLNCNKVLCLPHLGASTAEAEENCAVIAVKTLKRFLERGEIENSVNFPSIDMSYQGRARISIVNRNIPNMLSQISQVISQQRLNIKDIINRSRDEIAYTLIDLDNPVQGSMCDALMQIEGVINCRIIRRGDD